MKTQLQRLPDPMSAQSAVEHSREILSWGILRETQRPGRKPQHMSQQLRGLGQDQGNGGQALHGSEKLEELTNSTREQAEQFLWDFAWNGVQGEAVTQPA